MARLQHYHSAVDNGHDNQIDTLIAGVESDIPFLQRGLLKQRLMTHGITTVGKD